MHKPKVGRIWILEICSGGQSGRSLQTVPNSSMSLSSLILDPFLTPDPDSPDHSAPDRTNRCMHKNFTFTPVPIPERSKSAQIAPITSQQIPTNLQNASITRSATPNDVNNTRPPPLHPKLAAALGDARPITGSLELSTPPTAPQSPSSAACSAYSLPRLPSSSPSPPGQPRQLRNRLVPFQSPSLARRSAPRPAFTDRPPRRPARAPSIGSLSEEEETLEIQPLIARPHRIADHQ